MKLRSSSAGSQCLSHICSVFERNLNLMKSGISEFSFGYAVTEEIVRQQRHVMVGAPVFPSLYDEGRPGSGYDLLLQRVGFPLMLQFKLTQRMVKRSALEIKTHRLFSPPFYRIPLMPTKLSEQHNMLLSLDDGSNEVYYAAPLFSTQNELNDYYTANTVLKNCIFIKPNTIGPLPDDEDHHISIDNDHSRGFLFSSQPKQIGPLQAGPSFGSTLLEKSSKKKSASVLILRSCMTDFQQSSLNQKITGQIKYYRTYQSSRPL